MSLTQLEVGMARGWWGPRVGLAEIDEVGVVGMALGLVWVRLGMAFE